MNLRILSIIILYYVFLSLVFTFVGSSFTGVSYNDTVFNNNTLTEDDLDSGGLFTSGIDFGKFLVLITTGFGLDESFPSWISTLFVLWQSAFTMFTIGFLISSIWNG